MPLSDKVANFADMKQALRDLDLFDLDAVPDYAPPRGPNVPSYLAARSVNLLYLPVKCAEDTTVAAWLAALDGVAPNRLETGFTQKTLRQWKRQAGQHLSFTVVSHPLARAHDAFCRFILPNTPDGFTGIREGLARTYKVPLPETPEDPAYDKKAHHAAFLAFLQFLKGNLGGQTSVRIDGSWASQEACLRGLAQFGMPDAVLRAPRLGEELSNLAHRLDIDAPNVPDVPKPGPHSLDAIYNTDLERAARAAYQRDYMMFGFGAWRD